METLESWSHGSCNSNLQNHSPRKKVSALWRHFTRKDVMMVSCNECQAEIKVPQKPGSTSNLIRHLKGYHAELYCKVFENDECEFKAGDSESDVLRCQPCHKTFPTGLKWTKHMQKHKGEPGIVIPAPPETVKKGGDSVNL